MSGFAWNLLDWLAMLLPRRQHGKLPPRRCGTGSVEVVVGARQNGQRQNLDALVAQFHDGLRRSGAANRALLLFAVVHAARLLGKALADILEIVVQPAADAQGSVPPRKHTAFRGRPIAVAPGRTQTRRQPRHIAAAARRTLRQAARRLRLEILRRGKPALEAVRVVAGEVINNHEVFGTLATWQAGRRFRNSSRSASWTEYARTRKATLAR